MPDQPPTEAKKDPAEESRKRWKQSRNEFREAGKNLWTTVKKAVAAIVGVLAAVWFVLAAGVASLSDKVEQHRDARLKKIYRCPVCDRIPKPAESSDPVSYPSECDICHTNNADWRSLGWLSHANRFPLIVRVLIPVLLLFQSAVTWYALRSSVPPYAFAIRAAAVLSLIASLIVVALVFAFRRSLSHHELLRRVKTEGRGVSLVTGGGLLFALVLLLLAGLSVFMFAAGGFITGGSWTLSIQGIEGDPDEVDELKNSRISHVGWSPDGDRLIYSSDHDGDWEIYVYDIEAGKIITLTNNNDKDILPSWLQDGSVVYASDRTGSLGWKKMGPELDEKSSVDLTSWQQTAALSWAPDGQRYAFTQPGRAIFVTAQRLMAPQRHYALVGAIAISIVFPVLLLSVMLFGTAGYVSKIETESHRPLFFNDQTMVRVAYNAFFAEMTSHPDGSKEPEGDNPEASAIDPSDGKGGDAVDTDSPIEPIQPQVVSFEQTPDGGLKMIVNWMKLEEQDVQGEIKKISKDVLYEVRTDEWARIKSIKKVDPRKMESKPA